MKIKVDVPLMKEQAKSLLLNDTKIKYEFIGNESQFMIFEVTTPEGFQDNVVNYTKNLIRNTDWGSFTAYRVLEYNQMYSGQRGF